MGSRLVNDLPKQKQTKKKTPKIPNEFSPFLLVIVVCCTDIQLSIKIAEQLQGSNFPPSSVVAFPIPFSPSSAMPPHSGSPLPSIDMSTPPSSVSANGYLKMYPTEHRPLNETLHTVPPQSTLDKKQVGSFFLFLQLKFYSTFYFI
jgi:hypothetical protein